MELKPPLPGRKKILIVDDNAINVMVFVNFLDGLDVEIKTAENGYLALSLIREYNPDLILMDVHMPVLDGIETIQKVRKENSIVAIIAISASQMYDEKNKSIKAGANIFLSKPIKRDVLQKTIFELLNGE